MRFICLVLTACAVLGLAAQAAAQPMNCHEVKRYSAQPLTINSHGMPTVPFKVDGQELTMLVDLVGDHTMISERAAGRLKLDTASLQGRPLFRPDTGLVNRYVTVHSIEIAGVTATDKIFPMIPSGNFDRLVGADGILAQDLLDIFDVDLDFEHGTFGLYSQDHCPGKVVYWTSGPHAEIPFGVFYDGPMKAIAIPAEIDGKDVLAIVSPEAEKSQMAGTVAEKLFGSTRVSVRSLSLGPVTISNPEIRVFPGGRCEYLGTPCFALGMDVLRQFHLYISYKEKMIYATGGAAVTIQTSSDKPGARLSPANMPLYAAFKVFCADTNAKPETVRTVVETAGGKSRMPTGATGGSWEVTVNGHDMVVTAATVPSGDTCEVESRSDEGASVAAIGTWSGVGRFDQFENGERRMYHCQYQVKSGANVGYGSRQEADAAIAEGRLWDLTLLRDHQSASATLIHILK